jgi:exosortase H (IPTLxxWG-CTERM-specific)
VRFSAQFAALVILSEVIYYGVLLGSEPMGVYLAWTARRSGQILQFLGTEVSVRGNTIGGGGFAVQISPECDAVQLCAVLLAAIVSFNAPLRHKAVGMVLGVVWLESVNFVRIVSLYLVGAARPGIFQTAHETIWPVILIAITLATWVFWARRAVQEDPHRA